MSSFITKGYLIDQFDYETNHQIVTFICEDGFIYTNIALGVKKLLSKNKANLFEGLKSEIEFFKSSMPLEKMGKLKKVKLLETNLSNPNQALLIINKLIAMNKLQLISVPFYNFYISFVELTKKYTNQYKNVLVLYFLIHLTTYLGLSIYLDGCVKCNSQIVLSFSIKHKGFLCLKHFDESINTKQEVIKCLFYAFNKNINEVFNYETDDHLITINLLKNYLKTHSGIIFNF